MAPEQPGTVPPWVTKVTVIAVSVVAAVAAVASYVHIASLAKDAGEEWRAVLLPFSVDGLLTASSMVLYVRRRRGEPAGALPWLGLGLGLTASLGANLASVKEGSPLIDYVVSTWPPLALAVAFELLIMVTKSGGDEPAVEDLLDVDAAPAKTVGDHVNDTRPANPRPAPRAKKPRAPRAKAVAGGASGRRAAGMEWTRSNPGATAKEIELATGVSKAESYRVRDAVAAERAVS